MTRRLKLAAALLAVGVVAVAVGAAATVRGAAHRRGTGALSTLPERPRDPNVPEAAGRTRDGRYLTVVDTRTYLVTSEPFGRVETAAQRIAAQRFAAATIAAITPYRDARAARAAGYEPVLGDPNHYVKRAFFDDGRVGDPAHVESLVYAPGPTGPVLVGAMYLTPGTAHGPEIGGPATAWHFHVYSPPLCVVSSGFPVGRPGAGNRCALGTVAARSPEMLHVWIWNPAGSFASDVFVPTAAQIAAHFRHP